ncbi:FAD-binding oxidoreductase [Herbiconiux daphne]|uniref:FAD-binding oxidoreductase n=1 Tax=Herbiconiux daphne TaxID=2970914 RepID=A0ABT2GY48_9MICO|nr:FAD-binding oxidoreductase [Herbiconiux daphne]MCS5732796.1 FAD-binding oxidoreductase [Herbiconiux daphne]
MVEPIVAGWLPGTVASATRMTPHGRILELQVPSWPGNLPGQHLDLRLTAEDGYQAVRSYSVASFGAGTSIELAVEEVADGEVSPYLVDDVQPGDQLEVRGPIGNYFVWRDSQTDPVQLIAGGSGSVPLVSIARAHQRSKSTTGCRFIYSVRTPADALYADELMGLVSSTFTLDWVYTRQAPPESPRKPGRIDRSIIETTAFTPAEKPMVYVCGPTSFVEAVAGILVDLGHDPMRIKTERFGGV